MDSTFICKQGSLNRGHFIIALIFPGGREPACHPAGWPRLGNARVSKVLLGGGRHNWPKDLKRGPGKSAYSRGKLKS